TTACAPPPRTAMPTRSPTRRRCSRRDAPSNAPSSRSAERPSTTDGASALRHLRHAPAHLLGGDVLDVAGDAPPVPERVPELARAVAVELVLDRADRRGAGV